MTWMIGRAEAMSNPEGARRKALAKLQGLAELDDPESLVVPILLDALLMVESYRGARHQVTFLPELTRSIDALLRELTIIEKTKEWAKRSARRADHSSLLTRTVSPIRRNRKKGAQAAISGG